MWLFIGILATAAGASALVAVCCLCVHGACENRADVELRGQPPIGKEYP